MQEILYQYKCIGNKMLNTFDLLVSTTNELAKKVYVSYLTCPSEKKATLYFMIIMCAICNNFLKIRPKTPYNLASLCMYLVFPSPSGLTYTRNLPSILQTSIISIK